MKRKLSDKISLALESVSHKYITHVFHDYWGDIILIMDKRGKAFCRVYWYHDNNSSVYLDCLSVNLKSRKRGIGTELQKLRENIGVILGAKYSYLWVKKDSWMFEWYKRRGYKEWSVYKGEKKCVWMRKKLKK